MIIAISSCSPYRNISTKCPTYNDMLPVSYKVAAAKHKAEHKHPALNKRNKYYPGKRQIL